MQEVNYGPKLPGEVAASVSVVPSIGPTHGVQPEAKAAPNTNDVRSGSLESRYIP